MRDAADPVIGLSRRAAGQVADLRRHYEARNRPEAIRSLIAALRQASDAILRDPGAGLAAPRPYPHLARPGRAWTRAGRYWIAYGTQPPPVILGVFYDAADIPNRLG